MTDAITFDGTGRAHAHIASIAALDSADVSGSYRQGDAVGVNGLGEFARVLVQIGQYALVRMHRGLRNKLSNTCPPILVDMEHKLDFLEKLQVNIALFAKSFVERLQALQKSLPQAQDEQAKNVLVRDFLVATLRQLESLTQAVNDVAHVRDLSTYQENKARLESLPRQEYAAVERFYHNYKIFNAAFNRSVSRYNAEFERPSTNVMVLIDCVIEIGQAASLMVKATGDIFKGK